MRQDKVELYKDDKGVFRFKGKIYLWTEDSKSVVVDGETYTKSWRYEKEFDLDELKYWTCVQSYNFKPLNYKVDVEVNSYYNYMRKWTRTEYSTNEYVNTIISLFKKGLLDPRIKRLNTYQSDFVDYQMNWDYILKDMLVPISIKNYGWNNVLCYHISVQDLFDIDYNLLPKYVVKRFKDNGINLASKNELDKVLKLTNQKLRLCNQ